jgi:uncharacterized membrane protein YhaH (DUF805 family)
MNDANPYTAPDAALAIEQDELYQPSIFSFKGRIGRLRYLAYGVGIYLVFMVIMMGVAVIVGMSMAAGGESAMSAVVVILMGILYIAMIVMSVMIAKRRLNDLNRSGWWFLLFIVPLINFVMAIYVIFFPGTEGSNNFGPAPERNSLGVKFLALMVPVVFIGVGILAAIAIPQYQDYVMRAGG